MKRPYSTRLRGVTFGYTAVFISKYLVVSALYSFMKVLPAVCSDSIVDIRLSSVQVPF
jgi:hypothetical protein